VAEDLGLITPDVEGLKERFGLPGMRVLQFGFSGEVGSNPHAPHNLPENCVAYTGTHDNNTARGWFEEDLTPEGRNILSRYLGHPATAENVAGDLVRLVLSSPAAWAVCPLQDVLGLDGRSRMNQPAGVLGNWTWRSMIPPFEFARDLAEKAALFGRSRMP
jgi:4-alpha-glucanotransferase